MFHQYRFSGVPPHALLAGYLKMKHRRAQGWGMMFFGLTLLFLVSACQRSEPPVATDQTSSAAVTFLQDEDKIVAEAKNYELSIEQDAISVELSDDVDPVRISFDGASHAQPQIHEVANAKEVVYDDLFEKTDMRIYNKGNGNAAYDFILEPGANPEMICMKLLGENAAYLRKGELVQPLGDGTELRHTSPVAYQDIDGERIEVASAFRLEGDCLGFELGEYNSDYALTIDPSVMRVNCTPGSNVSIDRVLESALSYDENLWPSMVAVEVEVSWFGTIPGNKFNSSV